MEHQYEYLSMYAWSTWPTFLFVFGRGDELDGWL
jgi:hypothetical protein